MDKREEKLRTFVDKGYDIFENSLEEVNRITNDNKENSLIIDLDKLQKYIKILITVRVREPGHKEKNY